MSASPRRACCARRSRGANSAARPDRGSTRGSDRRNHTGGGRGRRTGIGLAADSGLSGALPQPVGPSRAAALMLLDDRFGAEEAERWGLVHRFVPDGTATGQGFDLARRPATGPTAAYAEVKSLLQAAAGSELPALPEAEAEARKRLGRTKDHRAAGRAFLDGRIPSFTGN
ncbi:enoyl-CoA hydratase-related protein [Streptomyces sp. NBC_01527]|uniref:enoyl-CoA hydratase-related protein n=1 Tax=unclassified Streptomyces TaxID=2593676 RepID=UPI002E108C6B|nr:enoyl-CoA hydratase-related protein [Streptomyces sp. NBC_01230]